MFDMLEKLSIVSFELRPRASKSLSGFKINVFVVLVLFVDTAVVYTDNDFYEGCSQQDCACLYCIAV